MPVRLETSSLNSTQRQNTGQEARIITLTLHFDRPLSFLLFLLCAAGILLLSAIETHAQETYDVTNVASDDHLNIRAEPSATAEKIGSLRFDAKDISVIGAERQVGRATWREILVDGQAGWVNAAYLTPTRAKESLFREPLACSGTEPFWALQLNETRGEFDSLAEGKSIIEFQTSRSAHGMPVIWSFRGTTEPDQSPVFALLEETNQCSDGMSDLAYKYAIRIDITDGPFYAGCCNPLPGQPAP